MIKMKAFRRPPALSLAVVADSLPVQLTKGFWFGSYRSALNRTALEALDIHSILSISSASSEGLSPEWGAGSRVECRTVHLRDQESAPLLKCVAADNALDFIASGIDSGGILVHCNAGRSRSPAVVALFLMSIGKTLDEALALTKEKRPCVDINSGFLEQLRLFESCGRNLRAAATMWERQQTRLRKRKPTTQTTSGAAADQVKLSDSCSSATTPPSAASPRASPRLAAARKAVREKSGVVAAAAAAAAAESESAGEGGSGRPAKRQRRGLT